MSFLRRLECFMGVFQRLLGIFVSGLVIFFPVVHGGSTVGVCGEFMEFGGPSVRVIWHNVSHPPCAPFWNPSIFQSCSIVDTRVAVNVGGGNEPKTPGTRSIVFQMHCTRLRRDRARWKRRRLESLDPGAEELCGRTIHDAKQRWVSPRELVRPAAQSGRRASRQAAARIIPASDGHDPDTFPRRKQDALGLPFLLRLRHRAQK